MLSVSFKFEVTLSSSDTYHQVGRERYRYICVEGEILRHQTSNVGVRRRHASEGEVVEDSFPGKRNDASEIVIAHIVAAVVNSKRKLCLPRVQLKSSTSPYWVLNRLGKLAPSLFRGNSEPSPGMRSSEEESPPRFRGLVHHREERYTTAVRR